MKTVNKVENNRRETDEVDLDRIYRVAQAHI